MAPLVGIRADGFKWIRAPKPELYDLRADPKERKNLYASDPRRAAVLEQRLERVLADSRSKSVEAADNPMTRETMENLISLGYLTPRKDRESMGGVDPKDGIVIHSKLEDARHFAQRRQWKRSEDLLREILQVLPGHVSARNVLALTLLRQERLEEAREEYRCSLETDPKQSRVLAVLGALELHAGRRAEAESLFRASIAITPGFVEALASLGFLETLRGNEKAAQEWYAKAIAADPVFPRTHRLVADLFYEHGDWAKALAEYENALRVVKGDFQALIQAGNCARRLGSANRARDYFHSAEKLRPDSWVPPYNLACLEALEGNPDEALRQLEASVARGLDDPDLLGSDADLASLRS
ncbi:MAG: tetratricopeptide repeat protein, partial [Vicinamibacteria bacterium]